MRSGKKYHVTDMLSYLGKSAFFIGKSIAIKHKIFFFIFAFV